jgi:hypothetical protein
MVWIADMVVNYARSKGNGNRGQQQRPVPDGLVSAPMGIVIALVCNGRYRVRIIHRMRTMAG